MASYCCAPCKALCACCGKAGCSLGDCCCPSGNKPNCFFFGFTSLFAIAPMIACLTVAITSFSGSGCFTHNQTNLGIFLLIDALFYFLFILFAWRVQRMLAKPYEKTAKEPGCCSPEVWSRVWNFMWKDITFLLFLIVAGCAVAWNVIGLVWANLVDEANKYRSRTICYVGMVKMGRASAGIMFAFLALLPFAFLIAVLLETASTRRRRQASADVEAGGAAATATTTAGPSTGTTQPQVAPSAGMHQAAAAMSQANAKTDAKVPSTPPPPKPVTVAPQAPPPAPAASEPAMGYPVATNTPSIYPPIPTGPAAPVSRDVPAPSAAPSAPPAAAPAKESAADAAKDAAKAAGHAVADVGKSLAQGISSLLHKKDKPAAEPKQ